MAIADFYYTWGNNFLEAQSKPFYSTRLTNYRAKARTCDSQAGKGILFVSTSVHRFQHELPMFITDFNEYLDCQFRFVDALDADIREITRIRPYLNNDGRDMQEIWLDRAEIGVETWSRSLKESLLSCKVYVCDHISSSFFEAIGMNVPTILFGSEKWEINSRDKFFFEHLAQVGVYNFSPEKAAQVINENYHEIEKWWDQPQRRGAIEEFRNNFCRIGPEASKCWAKELINIAKGEIL